MPEIGLLYVGAHADNDHDAPSLSPHRCVYVWDAG